MHYEYERFLRRVASIVTDSLYPHRCPYCEEISDGGFHGGCLRRMNFVTAPLCEKCGKQLISKETKLCHDCRVREKSFTYGRALLNYDEDGRHIMAQIKYNNKRDYIGPLGRLLADRLGDEIRKMNPDMIIPVPINKERMRERGFNQAALLALIAGNQLDIPVREDILIRNKKTAPQKKLGASERAENLKSAFSVIKDIKKGTRPLIIDDIYTTGATIDSISKELLSAGAEDVYFATFFIGSER